MAKRIFKKYKSSRLKPFLFFLFLATIFWVLTKFSREFTTTMTAKVNYENIPETVVLSDENVSQINFDLTANGFEILFYKLKKPSVDILVSKYYTKDQNSFTLPRNELLREVSSSFNRNLDVRNLSVESLKVRLNPIVLKKVKVLATSDITFKKGFNAIDSIVVVPDSVTISGPAERLKNIEEVESELISIKNVDRDITRKIKLQSPNQDVVAIVPNEVTIKLSVSEFSQVRYVLPVEVINLPPSIEIKLVPKTVSVSFDIGIDEFSKVSENSFRLICDFSKRNKEENFLIPELDKKPAGVENINFDPKKIDYLIFE